MPATTEKKFIGLSLSFCVKDICEGRVPLDAVEAVVPSFVIGPENTLEDVFEHYKEIYWRDYTEKAKEVLEQLTLLPKHSDRQAAGGWWVCAEDYRPAPGELDESIKLMTEDVEKLIS